MCSPTDRVKWWEYLVIAAIVAIVLLLVLAVCEGADAPPYTPTAPPLDALLDAKAAVHVDQPIVKLIAGVPYDRRLPGPTNWFRCPHCGQSNCWMFLGNALRREFRVTDAELDRAGYRNWGILYDNLNNRTWKPPDRSTAVSQSGSSSGCAGGACNRPIRSLLFGRWR